MSPHEILNIVFRAATFRAMRGIDPAAAAILAVALAVAGLYIFRRRR